MHFSFIQKKSEVFPERHLIYLIILGKGRAKYGIYPLKFLFHNKFSKNKFSKNQVDGL